MDIDNIPADRPVLIAGPTASGKSELALRIAERDGGVIINADASQVYDCWRVVTARPSAQDESHAPHLLYGHLAYDAPYSAGHWLREVTPLLNGPERPIIVGGTGLYFLTLTEGMAEIPATPAAIRAEGDQMSLEALSDALDDTTRMRIDMKNRARVQRAWEVLRATGRALADWQGDVIVINFWATWCPPCLREIPDFVEVFEQHRAQGVRFVGLSIDAPENVAAFASKMGVTYPLLIGNADTLQLATALGNPAQGLPFTVILDRSGMVRHVTLGTMSKAELTKKIGALAS